MASTETTIIISVRVGIGVHVSKMLKFHFEIFYVMDKALPGIVRIAAPFSMGVNS